MDEKTKAEGDSTSSNTYSQFALRSSSASEVLTGSQRISSKNEISIIISGESM
jgi:hypothetical protein